MMNNSEISYSIVIPAYQEEKLIEKTLRAFPQSLLQQYNAEIIVSDGGSTDATTHIAEQYTSNIVYHTEPRRQTIAEGRNAGASVAKGDVLIFINGDTIPADSVRFFQQIDIFFQQKQPPVALFCPVAIFPEEETRADRLFHSCYNTYIRFLNTLGLGMGRGECQIVRTEIFKKVGGYNSAIAAGEDFDLYRRIARLGKIATDINLQVYESPRRFRKYGYLRILWKWTVNALSVWMFRTSASEEWEAIR